LKISKETLKFLGGKIWVESNKDKGSIFSFTIPYKPIETDIKTYDNAFINKACVIITNNKTLFQKYNKIITSRGGSLWQIKSGMDAIMHFQDNLRADILLIDDELQGMNSITTTKAIKAFNDDLPIIVLADKIKYGKENALIAGCSNYITNTESEEEILITLTII